jgi:hypothetical protein
LPFAFVVKCVEEDLNDGLARAAGTCEELPEEVGEDWVGEFGMDLTFAESMGVGDFHKGCWYNGCGCWLPTVTLFVKY